MIEFVEKEMIAAEDMKQLPTGSIVCNHKGEYGLILGDRVLKLSQEQAIQLMASFPSQA